MNPKQLYETAYGYLLQRDYGAAEAAFDEFLRRHPNDPLAGNAQYWLGESLYVRGQYRAAAGAFLKGYQTYARSAKAPESLLKLAMSLQRLGPEGRRLLLLQRAHHQVPERAGAREDHRPDRAPARRLLRAAASGRSEIEKGCRRGPCPRSA